MSEKQQKNREGVAELQVFVLLHMKSMLSLVTF